MIAGVINSDALPVLERLMQFSGQRHRLIVNNIANLSTPGFVPADVSVDGFREQLSEAIDVRRRDHGNAGGDLRLEETAEIGVRDGTLDLRPTPIHENVLFHDENDRDLDRTMQDLVENFMTFRAASQLMRSRMEIINTAIAERF